MKKELTIEGVKITLLENDFFSLTDIARRFNTDDPKVPIANWMRNKDTIELLGAWESLYNPDFKGIEFETFKAQAGSNRFSISPSKWIDATNAIGIQSKRGRYDSGTFAHQDLALAFCAWLNPVFNLYVIKEFQRMKALENPEWDMRRALAKVNYSLHTGAVKKHLIPRLKGQPGAAAVLALTEEADLINLAVFGVTAAQWRTENPELTAQNKNIRDTADIYQLLVLANMEAYNETLLHYKMGKEERLYELETAAARQLETLYRLNQLPPGLTESRVGEVKITG
jgi:KilA-N domain